MEERGVQVGVIGQQVEDAITLAPNGNIEEGMQAMLRLGKPLLPQMFVELKLSGKGLLT